MGIENEGPGDIGINPEIAKVEPKDKEPIGGPTPKESLEEFQQKQRDINVAGREQKAEYHNEHSRNLLQKGLGLGIQSEQDIAQREAGPEVGSMDEKITTMVENGEVKNTEEAVMKLNLVEYMMKDPGAYKQYAELLVRNEKMTQVELSEYMLSYVKDSIEKIVNSGVNYQEQAFSSRKSYIVEAGIMTADEVNELARPLFVQRILDVANSGVNYQENVFSSRKNYIISENIMTADEVNELAKPLFIQRIENVANSGVNYQENVFSSRKSYIVEEGIMTAEEVDAIRAEAGF